MIRYLFYISTILFVSGCVNKKSDNVDTGYQKTTDDYDYELAMKLGADNYGMKKYIMAFLYRGTNHSVDSLESIKLQRAHLDNIKRLTEEGKLILAGPFLDNEDLRGIYLFDVGTIEEAKKLTETDPVIKEGVLFMKLRPWYGSASLIEIRRLHKRISKEKI